VVSEVQRANGAQAQRRKRVLLLSALFVGSLALLFLVGVQAVRSFAEMRHLRAARAGAPIEVRPWMTIPYIAHTYQVPEEELFRALGLAPTPKHRRAPLEIIARREGRDLDRDLETIREVVTAPRPPPTPPRPPTPRGPSPP
jgi:hypothetical protein